MADVFISYKRRTRDRVTILADRLRSLKLSVWFDARLEPGVSFDTEISREIRQAGCVLVCWTPDCFAYGGDETGFVRAEAALARDLKKLVPVFLEKCQLDPPFNSDHVEDLSSWVGETDLTAYHKLIKRIGHFCNRPGLEPYVRATAKGVSLNKWVGRYPDDPLAEVVRQFLEPIDVDQSADKNEHLDDEIADQASEVYKKLVAKKARRRFLRRAGIITGASVLAGAASWPFISHYLEVEASWDYTRPDDRDGLLRFVSQYGASHRGDQARAALARLDTRLWQELDKRSRRAIRAFIESNPGHDRLPEARELLAQIPATRLGMRRTSSFAAHQNSIRSIKFDPASTERFYTAESGSEAIAKQWQRGRDSPEWNLSLHRGSINGLEVLPGGRGVVTAGADGLVVLW